MADKSFADAALERYRGKEEAPEPAEAGPKEDDATLGKMFLAAVRKGDGEAVVTTLRKICGDE